LAVVVSVEPPCSLEDLYPTALENVVRMGESDLVFRRGVQTIAREVHEQLLEESLQEYGDIWRSLADR
jgi:hypothetical protein